MCMSAAIVKRSFGAKSRHLRLTHIRHRMAGHALAVSDISLIRNTDISALVVANDNCQVAAGFIPARSTQYYVMVQNI